MKVEDKRIRNKRTGTLGLWQINGNIIASRQSEALREKIIKVKQKSTF
jgi:hypothetical protein